MSNQYASVEAKASYAMGRQVGEQLQGHPFKEMETDAFVDGLRDFMERKTAQLSEEEQQQALQEIGQRLQQAQEEQASVQGQANIAAGQQFLVENAQRAEVVVTDSGLQYEVLSEGNGPKPGATDKVRAHYHGTLLDGTVFDSSVLRQEPIDLPVNGVIAGWSEALQLMPTGAKWKLYIPHELGYGERGAGASITPYSTLIFEVELLAVL